MPDHRDYTVAVICAIEFEMSAVRYMLDETHPPLDSEDGDLNDYVLGRLSGHNVVLAWLPGNQGRGATAIVATNMARTFPYIKWRFLAGIGGGVPSNKHDIRLGDVVVSMPEGQHGGVVQYDLGKDTDRGFTLKGFLSPPPARLRAAIVKMRSDHRVNDNKIAEFVSALVKKGRRLGVYERPTEPDVLFDPGYSHVENESTCERCNEENIVPRLARNYDDPEIHYGLIASGDRVMRSANKRSATVQDVGDILCFEMEAAGLMTEFSCIVIRGISDYADSHKNDEWQHYAAAAAAACLKELLGYVKAEGSTAGESSVDTGSNSGEGQSNYSSLNGRGVQHTGSGNFSVRGDMSIS
jgi:nucleoside phosphorylase